jgi:hypothetical protein
MGTTGHYVGHKAMATTEQVRSWLRKEYTWNQWRVLDLAPGTKVRSNWWIVLENRDSGEIRAMQVITTNYVKSEGMFYTKEVGEDMGPYSTDIHKRLFAMLTPLNAEGDWWAREWRLKVTNGTVRG